MGFLHTCPPPSIYHMQLINKIKSINNLFLSIDNKVIKFKNESGLACINRCGDCCLKNDISTTILEFLPAAYDLYRNNGFEKIIDSIDRNLDSKCVFFTPFSENGFCSNYKNRGLVCRLFGFSVRADKHEELTLVTCKHIKKQVNTENLQKTITSAPLMSYYYLKLFGIDPGLSVQFYPINEAIKKAIEIVLFHYQYRKRRA